MIFIGPFAVWLPRGPVLRTLGIFAVLVAFAAIIMFVVIAAESGRTTAGTTQTVTHGSCEPFCGTRAMPTTAQ